MCIRINLPAAVKEIISVLECNGFVAFVVGGCVRDSILRRTPHDWDICTSLYIRILAVCCESTPVFFPSIFRS